MQLIKAMNQKHIRVDGAKVLIMGLSFKENCPDIRNTRVVDMVSELKEFNTQVDIFDPWVNPEETLREYAIKLISAPLRQVYDAIILAVAHQQFCDMGAQAIRALGKPNHVIFDLKYLLNAEESDLRL
jgi:UDP-N-acetyl-D-galactosamine dehydrogenase